ncbi:hypothetical protein M407DRAFT_24702 [Tulasnella calospora MUT 4182]|uniref:Uncharacterized protein n=1 Tax=Tulasnella calospora MUT 4182 TaxID=1051891 RepID=A0A0C3QHD8_9AGAM|nr:hypothetical protein M407DRAFT_24702 [Tulasnella calospora MUT 4182]
MAEPPQDELTQQAINSTDLITLIMALSMTVHQFKAWIEFMCIKHSGVRDVIGDKGEEIWVTILSLFFKSSGNTKIFFKEQDGAYVPNGVEVECMQNPSVHIFDAWNALAFIFSIASNLDTKPRTKDWYLELLMAFTIIVSKIADEPGWNVKPPAVVHILWTKDGLARLQIPIEPDESSANTAFAHGIGSSMAGPAPGPIWTQLKRWRQGAIRTTIQAHQPEKAHEFTEMWQDDMDTRHRNFGLCAEVIPYLAVVYGPLEEKIYGLALRVSSIKTKPAIDCLQSCHEDPIGALKTLHSICFLKACNGCVEQMMRLGAQYLQYARDANQEPYLLHLNGTEEKCGTEI